MMIARQASALSGGRLPHLEMLRGVAAVMVCVGHVRGFVLVDYAQRPTGPLAQLFYLFVGRHHQAVMIFFVLSGFLVGGSVIRAHERGLWSWRHYAIQRLGRLWIVIVPALLLTLMWDSIGQAINATAYSGQLWPILLSGPPPGGGDRSLWALLGNLAFLQTILVPSFGSNGPMWSLANEFWYYLLFPLVLKAARPGVPWSRLLSGVAAGLLLLLLPVAISVAFLIWLFGVGAYLIVASCHFRPAALRTIGMAASGALLMSMIASAKWPGWITDFPIGLACAGMIPWLTVARDLGDGYRRCGHTLSEISYTLYLVHFPMLMFLYATLLAPRQFPLSAASAGMMAALVIISLLYATTIWFLFERNTDRWRRVLETWLLHSSDRAVREGG